MKRIGSGLIALAGMLAFAQGADAAVTITTHATRNMSCSGGVCQPIAAKANLSIYDLEAMLANGNATVEGNAVAPDITSNAAFSWNTSFGLTLAAAGNLTINHVITDSGNGAVALTYNVTGGGGALSFGSRGRLTFTNTSDALSINGNAYVLVPNIATLARLVTDNPSGNYALAGNYNARGDGKYTQSPIATVFAGNFNGLGNTISHLVIEEQNANNQGVGFFQQTGASGTIADLNVTNLTFSIVGALYVGGLVAYNQGTISGSYAEGTISAANSTACDGIIGGLAGVDDGTISFSHAGGSVTGDSSYCNIGGLVGWEALAAPGEIDHSYATASVTSDNADIASVGGLVGTVGYGDQTVSGTFAGSVTNTYATGAVSGGNGAAMGGLIGDLYVGSATNSTAEGAVAGGSGASLGGAVGYVAPPPYGNAYVDGLVAKGAVSDSGLCECGGAVGHADNLNGPASVADSVSYGTVTAGTSSTIGGFIGIDNTSGGMSNDGWDETTSGITDPSQGAGNIANDPGITGFN